MPRARWRGVACSAKHRLGPVAVRVNGKRAVATHGHASIDIPRVLKGVAVQLSSHARMFYRAELRDGALEALVL